MEAPVRIDLAGNQGNAYSIMGICADVFKQIHGRKQSEEINKEYSDAAMSGDYDNLIAVSKEYCDKYATGLVEFYDSREDDDESDNFK